MTVHTGPSVYFPGLNGLRAIAALAVLFSHSTLGLQFFGLDLYIFGKYEDGSPKATLLAGFGVSMFFAISGFLITLLLLKEKDWQQISIKKFYIRRILRIWPLYFLYLGIVLLTLSLNQISFEKTSFIYYLLLSANIPFVFGGALEFAGHYWSLGVEEQFYLFWPHIIKSTKNILKICILLGTALIVFKLIIYVLSKKHPALELIYTFIHVTRFQCMIIGGIGGILYFRKHKLIGLLNLRIVQLAAWIIIVLAAVNRFHLISVLDSEFISLVTLCIITGQIEQKNRLINLESKIFDFLGKISFGIYVLHPLVIFYLSRLVHFTTRSVANYILIYALITVTTIGLAYLSYRFFEGPILRFKKKYAVVKSKSAMSD
ncbi:MAG: acyltransferase [Bacteroidetes bacterium]|jgi:peptidoglycan/LPS O-acetylase OafA/YrhL|nr:acyltransferase [Bacteroidota bacterium]